MRETHHGWDASLKPPFIGYVISMTALISCYRIVTHHLLSHAPLVATIASLAIAQALVQLVFFLHLGLETKPHWKSMTFLFTVLVIVIIVGLSIWIMHHLNYNLMPPMEQPTK